MPTQTHTQTHFHILFYIIYKKLLYQVEKVLNDGDVENMQIPFFFSSILYEMMLLDNFWGCKIKVKTNVRVIIGK